MGIEQEDLLDEPLGFRGMVQKKESNREIVGRSL
jgi:hypothetical protein